MIYNSNLSLMRGTILLGLCLIVLFTNTHSFLLEKSHQSQPQKVLLRNPPNKDGGLQFYNTSGDGVTEEHLITFKNAINSASSFHRDDDLQRLRYIADQMDKAYSVGGKKFAIYQDAVTDGNYMVHVDLDQIYASVAPGVDRIFPKRSYFFNRLNVGGRRASFFPITGAKGKGITAEIENTLLKAVQMGDYMDYCDCSRSLMSFMSSLPGWNYFCYKESSDAMYYLYAFQDQYYSLKGKNCYFAFLND